MGAFATRAATKNRLRLDDAPDFFGPQVLARILGICELRAYELARQPGFPSKRIGRKIVVSKTGFLRWAEGQGWF
ncbi:MAG: helix-turn-helix domain-containing protein [Bacillota bacterium]